MRISAFVRNVFRRGRVERDLDDELRAYAAMVADERAADGLDTQEAHRTALADMGGIEAVKGHVRDRRAGAGFDRLSQDVRFALRVLRKSPGFTTVAVITLALGIAGTTAIFSVVDGVLLQPLAYPAADRVAFIWNHFSPQNMEHGPLSMADYLDLRTQARAFEPPAAVRSGVFDLTSLTPPEQVAGSEVTAGFFSTMRVAPLLGRTMTAGEDSPASPTLVVLSEALWRRRFGASSAVVGQPLRLGDAQALVIGVMPQRFQFPGEDTELWTNLKIQTAASRGPFNLIGVARLKDGITWAQAQKDTNRIARGIADAAHVADWTMPILPIREALVGSARLPLLVMFGAVLAVLLIASANIANLLLARGTTRQREIALRLSLGATRGRIGRQLMTESLVLAAGGCAAGTAVAWFGVDVLRQWSVNNVPRMADVRMNLQVFGFSAAASVLAVLLFGIVPAIHAARGDLTMPLKDGGRGTVGSGAARRMRSGLVVLELALSVVLLVCSGLFLRSFERLQRTETGVHAPVEDVLTMLVSPPQTKYPDPAVQIAFYNRALEKVRGLPGIQSAAFADSVAPVLWTNSDTFHVIGRPWTQEAFPAAPLPLVSDGYFEVLGVPLLRGRTFSPHDTINAPLVAVVSDTFARRYFPNEDPIGHDVAPSGPSSKQPAHRIVGVVGDVKFSGLRSGPEAVWYEALAQSPDVPMFLLVRASHPIAGLAPNVEAAIRSVDQAVIFTHEATLAGVVGDAVAQPRFRTSLFGLFAAIALLLAGVGTYGVVAYSVNQRTHEIGVRVALGARPGAVVQLVAGESARLALIGIAVGIPAAFAASRTITSLLFSTRDTDPATYGAVTVILLAAVGWATLLPARRAARVEPLVALRHE